MIDRPASDARIRRWLAEQAPVDPPPHLLEQILATSRVTARRPGWWRPRLAGLGPAWGQRPWLVAVRGAASLALIAAALLALAATSLLIGSRPQVPLPPGRPGWIVAAIEGELQLIDALGTVRRRLSTGSHLGLGAWSRDGRYLAHLEGGPIRPILVVRDDALAEVARIDLPADTAPTLTWSPDGRSIAFGTETESASRIYMVAAADGAQPVAITEPALQALRPSWSPDGSLIAFRGGVEIDQQALYIVRPDGSGVRRLSQNARAVEPWCGFPWTPDGRSIAFSTKFAGVWLIDADGADERMLIGGAIQAYCPSIAPDGRRLSAGVVTDTGMRVQVADLATRAVVTPPGPLWDGWPALWSPDGSVIVSNARVLGEAPNPRVLLDPDAATPSTTLFRSDAIVVDWQRLPP